MTPTTWIGIDIAKADFVAAQRTQEDMIGAYTINVAWALRIDDFASLIEEGKVADSIILNHDLFEVPGREIHKTKVQKTIFKGEVLNEGDQRNSGEFVVSGGHCLCS